MNLTIRSFDNTQSLHINRSLDNLKAQYKRCVKERRYSGARIAKMRIQHLLTHSSKAHSGQWVKDNESFLIQIGIK